jgi:enamine deaminase RidA (YjgF/YER057c/UK114 family)
MWIMLFKNIRFCDRINTLKAQLLPMIEEKLISLGVVLPAPPASAGSYVPVIITASLAFVSGQIPLQDGQLKYRGKVGKDLTIEVGQQAARLCAINGLAQLKHALGSLDRISKFIKVTGFVNCDSSFTDQPKVVNGASDFLVQVFGDNGRHTRAAVGVSSLPLDSAVEVEFIAEIS